MPAVPSLTEVIAALPLPTLAIDRAERIVAINRLAQDMLAMPAQGRHFITVLRQPALVEAVEKTLADQAERTARFVGVDGTFVIEVILS